MLISMEKCVKTNGAKFKGVIHIGAHLGEECESYRNNEIKNVIWVEANHKLMDSLKELTELLVPPEDNVMNQIFFNEVLTSKDNETIKFNITNNNQSSSILELGTHKDYYPHITIVETVELKSKRFDTIVKNENIDMNLYDFINLDVQGAELEVLKGFGDILNNSNIKAIYTEINLEELYIGAPKLEELKKFLENYGFEMVLLETVPQQWGDALFLRKK